jgi:hypothetical protein
MSTGLGTGVTTIAVLEVRSHAHASIVDHLKAQVDSAGGAQGLVEAHALVAVCVVARLAGEGVSILIVITSAEGLAETTGEIEVVEGSFALPGLHVENGRFAPRESAGVSECPREEEFNSEGYHASDIFCSIFPLVLKPTVTVNSFESGDTHNEVVHELLRY